MRTANFLIVSKATWLVLVAACLATSAFGATQESVLYSFHPSGTDAAFPSFNGVVADTNGNLYGLTDQGGAYDVGAVYELMPQQGGGWTEKLIHSFGHSGDGTYPYGSLVIDSAGNLYGTTSGGGTHGAGTAFEVTPNSNGTWTETVIHNFGSGSDGRQPQGGLIFAATGNLFGTTIVGGSVGRGTVFEMTPRQGGGWTETILHNFGNGSDGFAPEAPLIFDGAGNLYGTTVSGGTNLESGTVFLMKPRQGGGWTESVIHNFGSDGNDGSSPEQGLILDGNGNLFGATTSGGANGLGVVFELSPGQGGGWTETILHTFIENGTDGGLPFGSLVRDASGNLYGTAIGGGSDRSGVVFELSPAQGGSWTETILHSFTFNGSDGVGPDANLIFDSAGNLYSTTNGGGIRNDGTVFELSPQQGGGWTETVLYSFIYSGSGGAFPPSNLIADSAGNLYGTTNGGGSYDSGIAFKLTPSGGGTWTETLLHNFGHGFDGTFPNAGLVMDSAGNLYGTTESGGTHACGAVFKISPNQGGGWSETVIHNFYCNGSDGNIPFGGLIFDASGNLFGTTYEGGTHSGGAVFEMSPNGSGGWTERVVHNFNPAAGDGSYPRAGLVMDSSGNLFGTTFLGGAYGLGTVFEETPNGSGGFTERVLHNFTADAGDGWLLYGGVVLDAARNLYGTTNLGGDNGSGAVFQLTPQQNGTWTERVIYSFCSQAGCADGAAPLGSLTFFGSSPDLYGTTSSGGANGWGTVFQLTPSQGGDWTISTLHDFNPASGDGGTPQGGVIFDPSGNLYGTTQVGGGNYNAGTVFAITSVGDQLGR